VKKELVSPAEALALVLEGLPPPWLDRITLDEALGRALAGPLPCLVDQPPFDKSAMDGFAWPGPAGRAVDGGGWLRVVGTVAAGEGAGRPIGEGECARIMTGAPLPPGAGAVHRIERCELARGPGGEELVRFTRPEPLPNLIRRGENLRAGEPLLGPRILEPQDIGILASSGYGELEVARRPKVAVVSTGSEIAAPGAALAPAAIYDSNGPALVAQARKAYVEAAHYGIARDEAGELEALLSRALADCDVLLVSGGVSMGDYDLVPRILESLGVEAVFQRIAMRPGRPTFFGRMGTKSVFGLAGNPLAAFVCFELFVRPLLAARMGLAYAPRLERARLAAALRLKPSERTEILPLRLERSALGELIAHPLRYHGSSMLSVLGEADALLELDAGLGGLEAGASVELRLIRG
jgi:molybdopterin molybdotransferase